MPTETKLHEIAESIRQSIHRHTHKLDVRQLTAQRINLSMMDPPVRDALQHALWMCDMIDGFVDEGRLDKANRWIGFAQAVLWLTGVASIDESRKVNESKPYAVLQAPSCQGPPDTRTPEERGEEPVGDGKLVRIHQGCGAAVEGREGCSGGTPFWRCAKCGRIPDADAVLVQR